MMIIVHNKGLIRNLAITKDIRYDDNQEYLSEDKCVKITIGKQLTVLGALNIV